MNFKKEQVGAAVSLLGEHSGIIRFVATAEGLGNCDAWLDEPSSPGLGAIRYEDRLYIAGSIKDARRSDLLRVFLNGPVATNRLEGHAASRIPVRIFDPALTEAVLPLLSGLDLLIKKSEYLETAPPVARKGFPVAKGYNLIDVDDWLLSDENVGNIELLRGECAYRYDCIGTKGSNYLGIAAMMGNEIVGWCLSEFTCSAGAEIGIEVLGGHKRLGLAKAMADEYLQKTANKGILRVGWHCYRDNVASYRTALACGLVPITSYDEINIILK